MQQQQSSIKLKILKWAVIFIAVCVILNYNALAAWIQGEMDNNMYIVEKPIAVWHQTISQMRTLAHNLLNPSGNSAAAENNYDPNRWDRQGSPRTVEREYQVTVDENAQKRPKDTEEDKERDTGGSFVFNGAADVHRPPEGSGAQTDAASAPQKVSSAQEDYNSRDTAAFNERQARDGDANAAYDLANMYYTGNGIEKNYNEAAGWYRKAADHGVVAAQSALGTMYYNGEGVDKDYSQAVKYMREAADVGNSDAQFNLGNAYHEGRGVPKDDAEAIKWWQKAADRGNAKAQKMLKQYAPEGQ